MCAEREKREGRDSMRHAIPATSRLSLVGLVTSAETPLLFGRLTSDILSQTPFFTCASLAGRRERCVDRRVDRSYRALDGHGNHRTARLHVPDVDWDLVLRLIVIAKQAARREIPPDDLLDHAFAPNFSGVVFERQETYPWPGDEVSA